MLKVEVYDMSEKKSFNWKKFLLGAKRPLIAVIAFVIAQLAGLEGWSWVAGIGAERFWGTIEYYLKKSS